MFSLAPARDTFNMMWEGRLLPVVGDAGAKRLFAANYYNEMTMLELLAHAIPQVRCGARRARAASHFWSPRRLSYRCGPSVL